MNDSSYDTDLSESQQIENTSELIRDNLNESGSILSVKYEPHDLTIENTICVFDLHHVLMRPQYKNMAKAIIKHPKKKELLKIVSSPSVFRKFANRIGTETPEKSMKELEDEYTSTKHEIRIKESLSPLVTEICNSQKPDIPTFEVVNRLKKSGYGIYLLSNIGEQYFDDLLDKVPKELFSSFDGFYTTNPDDDYVNKPNFKIFERFLLKFNPNNKYKYIVFVDDSTKNVNACENLGMIGIHYKDAEQLEETLKLVGIKFKE